MCPGRGAKERENMRRREAAVLLGAALLVSGCGSTQEPAELRTQSAAESTAKTEETTEEETTASEEESSGSTATEDAEEASKPDKAEVKKACAALAKAIPDSSVSAYEDKVKEEKSTDSMTGSYTDPDEYWYVIDIDGNGIPELVRNTVYAETPEITLNYYDRTEGKVKSLDPCTELSFVPGTGEILLKTGEENEDSTSDPVSLTVQKYQLDNGTLRTLESGSMVTDYTKATQTLKVGDETADASGFLSVFDFDHTWSITTDSYSASGYNPSLARKILQNSGKVEKSDDVTPYLDYVLSLDPDSEETAGGFELVDVDGDGFNELEQSGAMIGTSLFTIIDGELVCLHRMEGSVEALSVDDTRDLLYSVGPLAHQWYWDWGDALTVQDGMVFRLSRQEDYFGGEPEDGSTYIGYGEASFLNGVMTQDSDGRDFNKLSESLAGDPVRKAADDAEDSSMTLDEVIAALKKKAGKDTDASAEKDWRMESYAMTLEGIIEEKVGLGTGQVAYDDLSGMRYLLIDLDGNGTKELVVGYSRDGFDVFLPRKGYTAESAAGASTNVAWNKTTGEILFQDEASEYDATDIGYRIEDDQPVYVESVTWVNEDAGATVEGCLYQDTNGAELVDLEWDKTKLSGKAGKLENMKNDLPEDGWRDLTTKNIAEDFDSIPEKIRTSDSTFNLWASVGDVNGTFHSLQTKGMSSWQQSYSMTLTGLLDGTSPYTYSIGYGGNGDEYAFVLQDLNGDGTPELLVSNGETGENGMPLYAIFHPVDGYAAQPSLVPAVVYGFDPSSGTLLYLGEEVSGDDQALEHGTFDGINPVPFEYYGREIDDGKPFLYTDASGVQYIDEDTYSTLHDQWLSDMASKNALPSDGGTKLTEEAIRDALGGCVSPVYQTDY